MRHYLLLPLFFGLIACTSTSNPEQDNSLSESATTQTVQNTITPGLYLANLPCDGCGSVRVNLQLDEDNTYDKTEEVRGGEDIYFETGKWVQDKQQIRLVPDQKSAQVVSTIRIFQVNNDTLTLLDQNGQPYQGDSSRYQFSRK